MQVEAIRKGLDERPKGGTGFAAYDSDTYQIDWPPMNVAPGVPTNSPTAMNYFISNTPDWDKVIKDSENDLEQMERLRKPNEGRLDITNIKGVIQEHLKSLSDLISSEPQSARATKARSLQFRFRSILSGK